MTGPPTTSIDRLHRARLPARGLLPGDGRRHVGLTFPSNLLGVLAVVMTMHTSNRSASASPPAPWTLRSAIGRSSRPARVEALLAAVVALACTLDGRIPLSTGVVLVALLPAVLVDVIDRRLPNRLVAGAALAGVASLIAEIVLTDIRVGAADMPAGALGMAGPLFVTHLVRPAAMGFGDVKVAVVAGAALGLVDPVAGLAALAIGSAVTALVGLVRHHRTVAFGPGLLGGAILSIVLVASPLDPLGHDDRPVDVPINNPASVDASHSEGDLP